MIAYLMLSCSFYGLLIGLRAEDLKFSDVFILIGWALLWPVLVMMFLYKVLEK